MDRESKSDGRVFRRSRARIPVALLVPDPDRKVQHEATVVQLSFLGARVRTQGTLEPGQQVELVRMTGPCTAVPARVVWVGRRRAAQEVHAGLAFTAPLKARITAA